MGTLYGGPEIWFANSLVMRHSAIDAPPAFNWPMHLIFLVFKITAVAISCDVSGLFGHPT